MSGGARRTQQLTAGFSGPTDLPLPDWAKKSGRGAGASAGAGAPASKEDEMEDLTTSPNRVKIDHRNIPLRWQAGRAGEPSSKDRRFAKPAVRPFPPNVPPTKRPTALDSNMTHTAYIREQPAPPVVGTPVAGPASTELTLLLDLLGPNALQPEEIAELIPPTAAPEDEEFLRLDQSKLPLELFDSSDFETHSPQEWLAIGCGGLSPYYAAGRWQWKPVVVLDYDHESARYRVLFTEFNKEKFVKRINLFFDAEDRQMFCDRLRFCMRFREQTKSAIRFQHFIEQQPEDASTPIADSWLSGIHARACSFVKATQRLRRSKSRKGNRPGTAEADKAAAQETAIIYSEPDPSSVSSLFAEVVDEYDIAMRVAILYHNIVSDAPLMDRYKRLRLPPLPKKGGVPWLGKVPIPGHAYEDHQLTIARSMRFSTPQVIHVFQWAQDLWATAFSTTVFMDTMLEDLRLPCSINDFKSQQRKHGKTVATRLTNEWRRGISNCLVDNVQNVYNFFESDPATHAESPLHHLVRVLQLLMADHLRDVTERSAATWVEFIDKFSPPAYDPTSAPAADGTPVFASTHWIPSLFDIELVPYHGEVRFSPSVDEIEKLMLSALTTMVSSVRALTTIEGEVMSLLPMEALPLLPLGANDPACAATDAALVEARNRIKAIIDRGMAGPRWLASQYERHMAVLDVSSEEYVAQFLAGSPPLEAFESEIRRFYETANAVELVSFDQELYGLVRVDCSLVKQKLAEKARRICTALMSALVSQCVADSADIERQYSAILARISLKPRDESELVALKEYIAASEATVASLVTRTETVHRRVDALAPFRHMLPADDFHLVWSIKGWPNKVTATTLSSLNALEEDKVRMMEKLDREKLLFEKDLERYMEMVVAFKDHSDPTNLVKIVDEAHTLENYLREASDKAEDFNKRELVFGFDATEYTLLAEMQKEFEPFYKLWSIMSDFHSKKQAWMTGPFLELQARAIESDVNEWWTTSYRLMKSLETTAAGPAEVAGLLRQQTDAFRKNIPLIQALASPALKDRHWEELSTKIGRDVSPDDDLTLQQLLDDGIMEHFEAVEAVCTVAEKEYGLDKALDAMVSEWETVDFEVVPYKETGTFVIRGTDDIMTLLDDHIVKVQTMMGSPFIKPILARAKKWERKLLLCQSLLDEWLACQRTWLYLEPIFASEDIMRQMPVEGRRFASVDSLWRKTMGETHEEPKVMEQASKDKLLEKFQNANKMLDLIQKGLNDYLEVKRLAFPRFYFLSNDELLEILSQTKDPRAVQPYLAKCFEGINAVSFRGETTGKSEDVLITHMVSAEGERVELENKIDPDKGANKGNVENWLNELQASMRLTIKKVCKEAMAAYTTTHRKKWILSWPGQVVLNVGQLYWTREMETAMAAKGSAGVVEYLAVLNNQLQDVVQLVRGKLTKMERTTLGALTVVDVHARDVVEVCAERKISSRFEFAWLSQLRYYWEDMPDDYNRYGTDPFNLLARIVNATQMYGYEYLGNSTRLVITPLTDRCYRTLMGAVVLMYGGAPAGPAGTGKTETVKDLSKAVAIQCVVFNCSDGLDYLAMAKFFKGLAASGAWSCFDEFNRIELEVLSVIAQQILTIQKAKRGRVAKFVFEGTTLRLNPDANCFITMNPGYAGRSELPDNLKALFRPCAMMVPDYALIAEIKLYSFGFQDARNMARKLTQVLRLSSEQLSSQKHYDYGMRAVFSILIRCGNLRQQLGDKWTEDLIVLSAITDVNLPKFTTNDIPLFGGITADLFPGVKLPVPDYDVLLASIFTVCHATNLQPKDSFVRSVVQLYETVAVRHGLMVVGQTCSGKTKVFHTLAAAMTRLGQAGVEGFCPVEIHTLNPKSITQGQLYGNFDETTHEWTDGVLAVQFRTYAKDTSNTRHWIIFDGPVDAVWIENMNTVLDDNKKLCLNSGEIIKMSALMTMMFEPEDLEEASPATVSRVGMVFLEPKRLGWRPQVQSYIAKLPRTLTAYASTIMDLCEWLVPPMLDFLHESCPMPTPVTDLELVASLLNMFDSLIDEPFVAAATPPKDADVPRVLEAIFIMALTWSIGVVTTTEGRLLFNAYLRALLAGTVSTEPSFLSFREKNPTYDAHLMGGGRAAVAASGDVRDGDLKPDENGVVQVPEGIEPGSLMQLLDINRRPKVPVLADGHARKTLAALPEDGSVYEYCVDAIKGTWTAWMKGVGKYTVPAGVAFNSILVPTIDTIRNAWVIKLLMNHNKHVLCVGDTGTGKSVSMVDILMNQMDSSVYQTAFLTFSAQTSANQTQDIIDSRLSRRRKGIFGPPLGQRLIVFVDDLNMPAKEAYGAQPPIEILRQWMDHRGWYDRKDKELPFMELVDVQFVGAMGPPGGGRTRITQRYVRHFNMLSFVPFDSDSLKRVFSAITEWFMGPFTGAVRSVSGAVVDATIDMYHTISKELLPTPAKSHYTFNLRDLSKVFQGIQTANPTNIQEASDFCRLWAHECMRVFHDRLVSAEDRTWFMGALAARVKTHFKKDWAAVKGNNDVVLYGNFMKPRVPNKLYEEIADHDALRRVMAEYLVDYNNESPKQMSLVLFMNAIEHVARISRVLAQPYGNALLVGVGGSGRKSLTTLAVYMAEFELYQVEISKVYGKTEWRDDLKSVLRQAGEENKQTVFLFSDTQIVLESFVEDINNVLNNGEVPNLFELDERAQILESMSSAAEKSGREMHSPAELYSFFVERCRQNLHVVLCFSPIGDAFRTRLRMFPALVNCCTIDWFTAWPEEALRSVAAHFLDTGVDLTPSVRAGVIDVCVDMQERVSNISLRFLSELRRYYYVTPTSYLELINTFKDLIGAKRKEVLTVKYRYENGLTKLAETAVQVQGMQQELTDLQPKLQVASAETTAMLGKIAVMSEEAAKKREVVASEEKLCAAQAADAGAQKAECESMLAEAIPALENAIKALATLQKSDITEVKAMKKPPDGVKLTLEAVCILLGVEPKKVPNPAGVGPKVDDYWEPAQKHLLGDPKFLDRLKKYDKDDVPQDVIDKVRPYTQRDDFVADIIERASKAAAGLCKWVHAIVVYDRVAKVVAPKRIALAAATADLQAAEAALQTKQSELRLVEEQLAGLQTELQVTMAKKEELERQVVQCSNQLDRAQRLIGGLGGERTRWQEAAMRLQSQYDNIVGDILLSAGLVAYLGAFTATYREECISQWSRLLISKGIPCAERYSLSETLGEAVQIRDWTIARLPNDSFSIDNAIMLYKSKRWPLMIDPQGQANRWVRNTEAKNNLKVVKQSSNTFVRTIENAIQFGAPVLLENVPEFIDPVLESVLTRQVVKAGGVMTIRVGDNTVEYDNNFRLYITTKLRSPHYPPETCVKVNLLNFMATVEGLQDQMLGITVQKERPDLEQLRERLVLEDAENKRQLKEIEDKILALLAASEGNILEDETLINTLSKSKETGNAIMAQVEVAERTQQRISEARAGYAPVAKRASLLFFCIADLAGVDPMYQYSLEWFVNLFLLAVDKAPQPSNADDLEARLKSLNDTFTYTLYENVCRSLFAKDKLLFSFLLCVKVLLGDNIMQPTELRFLLAGSLSMTLSRPNPTRGSQQEWLSDKSWADILELSSLPAFTGFADQFVNNLKGWQGVFNSTNADGIGALTGGKLTQFQEICVMRCVRPDKVVPRLQQYIADQLGTRFIEPPQFDLAGCFGDSNCTAPLIFVLSPGADPMTELLKLADKLGYSHKLFSVSLGQGQGTIAENAINEAVDKGTWVCLQNCHLAESWMPTLERLCEEITPERAHPDFRLWLTAMPSPKFPVSILQNGVKMTLEPPKGMRPNLLGSFSALDEAWFESCRRPREFKKMLFGLCFFHATVRERRKFGPLGWNIPYDFSEPDLRISLDQLKIFLDQDTPDVPFETLNYLTGECNYGGRVTDDKDRRCIMEILTDFYCPEILTPTYKFSPSGVYYSPEPGSIASYMEFIRQLPLNEAPEVFGLHDNADITCAIQETNALLDTALSLQPRQSGGGGKSWDETLMELSISIAGKLPPVYDIEKVEVKYPVRFEESMNTVLTQELMRFNKLIATMAKSLAEVQKAIKGLVVMSEELEAMGNSMVKGQVPAMWNAVSYPSLKPLGSWVTDLLARLSFLQNWIDHGKPALYWISGFFFTQSFLTGTRQNFARKYTIPIDEVSFDFQVMRMAESHNVTRPPADGCYVYGLFLEGANWDDDHRVLSESRPKELYVAMPNIWLIPKRSNDLADTSNSYECPVYKTSERRGTLSTTGHSTNFVMMIFLPMSREHTSKHWVKRGVAMLTQLDS